MRPSRIDTLKRLFMLPFALASAAFGDCGSSEDPQEPMLDLVVRRWWFTQYPHGAVGEENLGADRVQIGGVAKETHVFGGLIFHPPGVGPDAVADVYSNESGKTYWVSSQAPSSSEGLIGDSANLLQVQYFKKTTADAKLTVTVSKTFLEAIDGNPGFPTAAECRWHKPNASYDDCGRVMWGHVTARIEAFDFFAEEVLFRSGGYAEITGWRGFFGYDAKTYGDSLTPFWDRSSFDFDPDVEELDGGHAIAALHAPLTYDIPLSSVRIGDTFYVSANVRASTLNLRQRETYLASFFRDPQSADGVAWAYSGVEPIATPTDAPAPTASVAASPCASGTADPAAGTVAFEAATFAAPELPGAGATVVVTRSGGGRGAVSALVTTADDVALAGDDYTAVATQVLFADGEEGSRAVSIPLRTDGDAEPDETLRLVLAQPMGCAALGDLTTAVLTIQDDDRPVLAPPTFTVGGTVSGLVGTGLLLRDVITGFSVTPGNGAFALTYDFPAGTEYDVRVETQPTGPIQVCTVTGGAGTIVDRDVIDVAVVCVIPGGVGGLDPGFGDGGKVTVGSAGQIAAMALQTDGKIVTVGDRILARYLGDGTLDPTFGSGGEVTVAFDGGSSDEVQAVAVQPDGDIVVGGFTRVGAGLDFAVARFLTDGSPDPSFGTGGSGSVVTDFAGGTDEVWAVLIQPDGKIVAAGHAATPSPIGNDNDFAAARYTAAGELDTGFGTGGKVMTNIRGHTDLGHAATLASDGGILIAGRVADGGGDSPDVGIVKYDAAGHLDGGFGVGGIVAVGVVDDWDEAAGVAVQPDGKVVVAVKALLGSSFGFAVARFDAGGGRELGFGSGGLATALFGTENDYAGGLALQPDGQIVVVGQAGNLGSPDFGIARFTADGSPDASFGTDGKLAVDFFGSSDGAVCTAIDPSGRILAGGFARNGTRTGVALARILP